MTTSFKRRHGALVLISSLLLLFCASCHRHLSVAKSDYKQYSMDTQLTVDSSVVKYYLPYKEKMQAEMNKVIGQTEQELTKPSTPETLMGNFFADAMLKEGLKKDPTIQFTLSTKGGLRTTFPKGNITVSNVFELMPFENELVVLKLTGQNVQQVIDFIVKKDGEPVSGIRMKIKDHKAFDITIAGQPFDINKTYNLLTYDYLADGGDDLECLRNPIERREINQKVREAILENISDLTSQGKKINAQLDERISIVND